MKPFVIGAAAGYLLACFLPIRASITGRPGNLLGNAGGFTGGNPGTPQGPGFFR